MRMKQEYSRNWTLLNSSKGGELGTCSYKWTKKAVFERVNVCSSYLEFREKFPGAYSFALKRKWNKEIELILSDYSKQALEITNKNLAKYNVKAEVLCGDLFEVNYSIQCSLCS